MYAVHLGVRGALATIFLVSATAKFRNKQVRSELSEAVGRITPRLGRASSHVAWGLAFAELAVALLVGFSGGVVAFALASVVLAAFAVVLIVVLLTGTQVRCQCFGADGTVIGANHIVRNCILLGLAVVGVVPAHAALPWATVVVAVSTGVVLGAALTRWDDIVFLLAPGSTSFLQGAR